MVLVSSLYLYVATSPIIVAAPRGRAWVHLNNRESGDFLWAYYTIIFTSSWKMGSDLGLVGVGSAVEKYKGNLNILVVDGLSLSAASTMGCKLGSIEHACDCLTITTRIVTKQSTFSVSHSCSHGRIGTLVRNNFLSDRPKKNG